MAGFLSLITANMAPCTESVQNILVFNLPELESLRMCTGPRGLCSRTHKPHLQLQGLDATGQWMTKRAQAYPSGLCTAVASAVRAHLMAADPAHEVG